MTQKIGRLPSRNLGIGAMNKYLIPSGREREREVCIIAHYHKFAFAVTPAVRHGVRMEPKHTKRNYNATLIAVATTDWVAEQDC